jgi:hypothetical protein
MYLGEIDSYSESYAGVAFVGTVSAAVGAGLLISGYVSLRLSKRLGLINGKPQASSPTDVVRSS